MHDLGRDLIVAVALDLAVAGVFTLFGFDFFDVLAVIACVTANHASLAAKR